MRVRDECDMGQYLHRRRELLQDVDATQLVLHEGHDKVRDRCDMYVVRSNNGE